jgi:quercetin dioxygenase-like cupin family protein
MKHSFLSVLLPLLLASAPAASQTAPATGYLRITQDQVRWSANPSLPAGVRTAVLYGDPRKAGLYVMQVSFPPHVRLPVHSHPDERVRTVISGTYYSAVGEVFDELALQSFPAGTLSHVGVGVWQFAQTREEPTVIQIVGFGPTGIDYRNPDQDPRQTRK